MRHLYEVHHTRRREGRLDLLSQVREQVHFTTGRLIIRGKLVSRGKDKCADYILHYKPNIPIALIEAKNNNHPASGGMQQGLGYAETLDIPFVFSSNGDGFVLHEIRRTSNRLRWRGARRATQTIT